MSGFYARNTCRLCGSKKLLEALKLTPTPPANGFPEHPVVLQTFPLEVVLCGDCGHSQLQHVVAAELLYTNYLYATGTSPSFVRHFDNYAAECMKLLPEPKLDKPLVVEIGCNDGTLLDAFKSRGCVTAGFEPGTQLAVNCSEKGHGVYASFFDRANALNVREDWGSADLIVANNVLAHIDNLDMVMAGVDALLAPKGSLVFEVQYLADLIEDGLFDMIYHEHLDYHALTPLIPFFAKHGFEVYDAYGVKTHGGSLRCFVARKGVKEVSTRVTSLIDFERRSGVLNLNGWNFLKGKVESAAAELTALLQLIAPKATIVGYGAPAKATTLLHHFGLTTKLAYVVDDNPMKQGRYIPGTDIEIRSSDALYDPNTGWPDYVLVLAWNVANDIITKNTALMDKGVHFIVPMPQLETYP